MAAFQVEFQPSISEICILKVLNSMRSEIAALRNDLIFVTDRVNMISSNIRNQSTVLTSSSLSIKGTCRSPGWVHKMIVFGEELYCVWFKDIHVYDLTLKHKRRLGGFMFPVMMVRSMTITIRGRIIIATERGLVEVSREGKKIRCLNKQKHYDVISIGFLVKALRGKDGFLHLDVYYECDGQLQLQESDYTIPTEVKDDGHIMTCALATGSLFICNISERCIYQINITTGILESTHRLDQMVMPRLCGSDGTLLLITDHKHLYTLDFKTGECRVLNINGVKVPMAAVVKDRRLFVNASKKWLYKIEEDNSCPPPPPPPPL